MKTVINRLGKIDPVAVLIWSLVLGGFGYLCFAYNLQFYTEDERYVQMDMTRLESLYQWGMTNYRISSSFGNFLYYPLMSILEMVSRGVSFFSGGTSELKLVPMMLSKLVHSILVFAGWIWFSLEAGRLLEKRWGLSRLTSVLCLLFTAMLPLNIFLVKTNNYDSIYAILCLVGIIWFYDYSITNNLKKLGFSFLLFALAMQEKFAAYPFFALFFALAPFFMKGSKVSDYAKAVVIVLFAVTIGSLFPSFLRFVSELIWASDPAIAYEHISKYQPFLTFLQPLGTARHFIGIDSVLFNWIMNHSFEVHLLGFAGWSAGVAVLRQKIDCSALNKHETIWVVIGGSVQVLFLLWAFAALWYSVPQSGKFPFDTPPPGTYVPPHLSDSHATFYYGTSHAEYIFIRLMQTIGFFKPMVYSPMLILIALGPVFTFLSLGLKDIRLKSMSVLSMVVFNATMVLVVVVNATGVPFGGRYTNIYLTLLGVSAFIYFIIIAVYVKGLEFFNRTKTIAAVAAVILVFSVAEILPYGSSFQVFGNWFYPKAGQGGWGEPTSALVQASRKDPFLKQALGKTYTTYTGLAIEKPFLTPLINLRLIRSRSEKNYGKLREIRYLLAEGTAVGQNPWLKNVLDVAKGVDGAIVWKWERQGVVSAWLIDLYPLNFYDFKDRLNLDECERHYRGEWFF